MLIGFVVILQHIINYNRKYIMLYSNNGCHEVGILHWHFQIIILFMRINQLYS